MGQEAAASLNLLEARLELFQKNSRPLLYVHARGKDMGHDSWSTMVENLHMKSGVDAKLPGDRGHRILLGCAYQMYEPLALFLLGVS